MGELEEVERLAPHGGPHVEQKGVPVEGGEPDAEGRSVDPGDAADDEDAARDDRSRVAGGDAPGGLAASYELHGHAEARMPFSPYGDAWVLVHGYLLLRMDDGQASEDGVGALLDKRPDFGLHADEDQFEIGVLGARRDRASAYFVGGVVAAHGVEREDHRFSSRWPSSAFGGMAAVMKRPTKISRSPTFVRTLTMYLSSLWTPTFARATRESPT